MNSDTTEVVANADMHVMHSQPNPVQILLAAMH